MYVYLPFGTVQYPLPLVLAPQVAVLPSITGEGAFRMIGEGLLDRFEGVIEGQPLQGEDQALRSVHSYVGAAAIVVIAIDVIVILYIAVDVVVVVNLLVAAAVIADIAIDSINSIGAINAVTAVSQGTAMWTAVRAREALAAAAAMAELRRAALRYSTHATHSTHTRHAAATGATLATANLVSPSLPHPHPHARCQDNSNHSVIFRDYAEDIPRLCNVQPIDG